MPSNSGQFSGLLAPGLRKWFFDKFASLTPEFDKMANNLTSKRAYEEDRKIAALGAMPLKPEGTPVVFDDFIQGDVVKRYTHSTFGLGYRITEEAYDDDLYGVFKKINDALARAAAHTREVTFWDVLNNAFNAAFTGLDSLPLCHTAHTLLGGGTYGNRPTVDTDLGIAALQAGITSFEKAKDERSLPIMMIPKYVLIPPDQKWLAREILNSAYKPFTSNNEINALVQDDLQYFVSHYLTDTDAWFLVAAPGEHDLNYFQRWGLRFDAGDDFDTGDAKFKATQRMSAGFSDWRGVYGSPGA